VVDDDRDSKAKECERIVESVAAVASGQHDSCAPTTRKGTVGDDKHSVSLRANTAT